MSRNRLTFELSDELLEAIDSRATFEERSYSSIIRRALSATFGLTSEAEPPRDTTPNLPGMP